MTTEEIAFAPVKYSKQKINYCEFISLALTEEEEEKDLTDDLARRAAIHARVEFMAKLRARDSYYNNKDKDDKKTDDEKRNKNKT